MIIGHVKPSPRSPETCHLLNHFGDDSTIPSLAGEALRIAPNAPNVTGTGATPGNASRIRCGMRVRVFIDDR
jgi:hypothetical protein